METLVNGHTNKCNCNCGSYTINKGAKFLPGHDQRLVSVYGRELAEFAVANNRENYETLSKMIDDQWPNLWSKTYDHSVNLQVKWEKNESKSKTKAVGRIVEDSNPQLKTQGDYVTVKVGRWTYEGIYSAGGTLFRKPNRDGSGDWMVAEKGATVVAA